MAIAVLSQVKKALSNLNSREVRAAAERPVTIGLVGASAESLGRMETYFAPPHLSPERRAQAVRLLVRGGSAHCTLNIYESNLLRPARAFSFDPDAPDDCVRRILRAHEDLVLPLARSLYPFRKPAAHQLIRSIAKENALFCLATAIPDVVPSLGSMPWAAGEFGSDAAFLTANQIRMAFYLAAASDRPVGYPRAEIGDRIDCRGRVRMARAGSRAGRQSAVRRRIDSESRHRLCGNLRRGRIARTAVPAGLRIHSRASAKPCTKKPTNTDARSRACCWRGCGRKRRARADRAARSRKPESRRRGSGLVRSNPRLRFFRSPA